MGIPDITKLTWPFNVALVGAAFSVFSLIYNVHYIYYGFITFIYGVICHLVDTIYSFWLKDKKWGLQFAFISQIVSTGLWIILLLIIYR
jgi:hypothetical protein